MCHDENEYPNPDKFDPERYLTPDGDLNNKIRDPESITFGFGKRVCPGKHFALESLWLSIARMLAVYEIGEPTDLDGRPVGPEREFTTGLLRYFFTAPTVSHIIAHDWLLIH